MGPLLGTACPSYTPQSSHFLFLRYQGPRPCAALGPAGLGRRKPSWDSCRHRLGEEVGPLSMSVKAGGGLEPSKGGRSPGVPLDQPVLGKDFLSTPRAWSCTHNLRSQLHISSSSLVEEPRPRRSVAVKETTVLPQLQGRGKRVCVWVAQRASWRKWCFWILLVQRRLPDMAV